MAAADRRALPDGLLADIKIYLDITWDDPTTDTKVSGWIASGMVYLDRRLGDGVDYTADCLGRTLLMEYCRYSRDSALDVFENNYRSMILDAQSERRLDRIDLEGAISPQAGDLSDL